jgi:hypothetical protein
MTTFSALTSQLVLQADEKVNTNKDKRIEVGIHLSSAIQKLTTRLFREKEYVALSFTKESLKEIDVSRGHVATWLLDIEETQSITFYSALRICLQSVFARRNDQLLYEGPLQIVLRGDISVTCLRILDEFGFAPDELHFTALPDAHAQLLTFFKENPHMLRNIVIFKCNSTPSAHATKTLKEFVSSLALILPTRVPKCSFLFTSGETPSALWPIVSTAQNWKMTWTRSQC